MICALRLFPSLGPVKLGPTRPSHLASFMRANAQAAFSFFEHDITALPRPSDEQQIILDAWRDDPYSDMDVQSYAGSGKTKTAEMIAAQDPRKGLYVCYNKNIQTVASRRFGKNMLCKTGHALAFGAMRMYEQKHRLSGRLFGSDVADLLGIPDAGHIRRSTIGQWVLNTIDNFCNSASRSISTQHTVGAPRHSTLAHSVAMWANRLWSEMTDPTASVPITHDVYLKQFQLREMKLPSDIEFVILDEAQDSNPVILDIIEGQSCPIIKFGDQFQSIHLYRGAVNAMTQDCGRTFHLSQSWRFGPRIATLARSILSHVRRPPHVPIRGNPTLDTRIVDTVPAAQTTICRTNVQLFAEAVECDDRMHIVGGGEELLKLIAGGWSLFVGQRVRHVPTLARFKDYQDLEQHAEESTDRELVLLTKIIKEYGSKVPHLIADVERRLVPDRQEAARILTTAHRFKGDESPNVRLADDFPTLADLDAVDKEGRPKLAPEERDQELHLLYVASTRPTALLQPNTAVRSCVAATLDGMRRR